MGIKHSSSISQAIFPNPRVALSYEVVDGPELRLDKGDLGEAFLLLVLWFADSAETRITLSLGFSITSCCSIT